MGLEQHARTANALEYQFRRTARSWLKEMGMDEDALAEAIGKGDFDEEFTAADREECFDDFIEVLCYELVEVAGRVIVEEFGP